MIVGLLVPAPHSYEPFKRISERFIPKASGCYVLSTFSSVVLYVGLATIIRNRFLSHLDDTTKTVETPFGRATLFYWIEI